MSKFTLPFRMGDVVSTKKGGIHIIAEVNLDSFMQYGEYQYSTDRGAWYEHSKFSLVRECDKASIKKLKKTLQAEFSEEEE